MASEKLRDLKSIMGQLEKKDQRKLVWIILIQTSLGVFDLIGVLMVGLLGAVSVNGIPNISNNNNVDRGFLLNLIPSSVSFNRIVGFLIFASAFFLIGRTIISIIFTRKILFFLSKRGADISTDLISKLFSKSILEINSSRSQEIIFSVTTGVELITIQVLATGTIIIADISLLLILMTGLFLVDQATACALFFVFTVIIFFLYRFMHIRASKLGNRKSRILIAGNGKIIEAIGSYRELVVRNQRNFYAQEVGRIRHTLAGVAAEINFLPYVSKYVIETSVVVSALMVGVTQFIFFDSKSAITTMVIFMVAGARIAPALLRIQQGVIAMKGALAEAQPTMDLIRRLNKERLVQDDLSSLQVDHPGFVPEILIQDLNFTYPSSSKPAISNINLHIVPGETIAFVGPSGGGKTTLIDLMLGILTPDDGQVLISGAPPLLTMSNNPGAISYVPQDVTIIAGTVRENVAFGYPIDFATDGRVVEALKLAKIDTFVAQLSNGIDTYIDERGSNLSGGQKQRLGIARALFSNPKLLVLDEATSSLDNITEFGISESIQKLKGETTIIIIAHRLSTVRESDCVVYIENGKITAKGTFEEVSHLVPDFNI